MIKRLLSPNTVDRVWTFTVIGKTDSTVIRVGGLSKRQFERLYAETLEIGIQKDDIGAFLKRWIEEDEGEWVEINGERYP